MARSGSTDFDLTRDGIIRGAIRIVKALGGKPITGAKSGQKEFANASDALNIMLKEWQGMGVGLWLTREISMPFAYRDGKYSLGTSGDHASETLYVTEVATAQTSGNSTLVLDSTSGAVDGDAVGIQLDDDTMQWTTINGTPAALTITLTAALTDDVAVDNEVMFYTTKSGRPLSITEARLVSDAGSETPLYVCDRQEWMNISDKDTNGTPSQIYYDHQLDSGILYIWPRPEDVGSYLKFTARVPVQDFDAAANDPDFPVEIHRAVKWGLADELALEYPGIDAQKLLIVSHRAEKYFNRMADFDAEYGSIQFEVDHD
jgi:hypothetical protein